jgi:hypothetical protein
MNRFDIKDPAESVLLAFNFAPGLAPGVTLSGLPQVALSVILGTDANPGAVLNGAAGFDSTLTQVVQPVTGGLDGCEYQFRVVSATTSAKTTLTCYGVLPVRSYMPSSVGGSGGSVSLGIISANLAVTQNNFAPPGFGAATTTLLLTPFAGGSTITGMAAGATNQTLLVCNVSATDSITFLHKSGLSLAANQFSLPMGQSLILPALSNQLFSYTNGAWLAAA